MPIPSSRSVIMTDVFLDALDDIVFGRNRCEGRRFATHEQLFPNSDYFYFPLRSSQSHMIPIILENFLEITTKKPKITPKWYEEKKKYDDQRISQENLRAIWIVSQLPRIK